MPTDICVARVCCALRSQEGASELLAWQLQALESHPVWKSSRCPSPEPSLQPQHLSFPRNSTTGIWRKLGQVS